MILPQTITDGLRPGILAPFHENGSRPLSYEVFLVVLFPARYFLMHSPGMLTIYTYHHTRRGGRMVPYNSLWANSPGRGGKQKESLQLCLWNLNICIEKVNAKCWLVEMTVTTSLPLACVFRCLFTFAFISASPWLAEIWQLSWRGATGELELEFKFQRWWICKLSSLLPPLRACSQATPY